MFIDNLLFMLHKLYVKMQASLDKSTCTTSFYFVFLEMRQFDPYMYVYFWPRKITVWSVTFIRQSFYTSIKPCGMMIEKGQEKGIHWEYEWNGSTYTHRLYSVILQFLLFGCLTIFKPALFSVHATWNGIVEHWARPIKYNRNCSKKIINDCVE